MTLWGWAQITIFFVILVLITKPLGSFISLVFEGRENFLTPVVGPLERFLYRLTGINPDEEMDWKTYLVAMLLFSMVGVAFLYLLLRMQGVFPLNPQKVGNVAPDQALNTAVSFVTNTNWQNYGGENGLSYLTQMLGLTVQNFLSAAVGMALLAAFIRGFSRYSGSTLGNFWADMIRSTLYVLLPLSMIVALFLVAQGSVQTFAPSIQVHLLQPEIAANGQRITTQTIAVGPAASQIAIKHLGTNGGGFFNANAAHPFENPTPLTNMVLMLAETAIPAALTYTFGKMVGNTRQGWTIFIVMIILVFGFNSVAYAAEASGNPRLTAMGVDQTAGSLQPGGNMEGKEERFGIAPSALFSTVTTATSTGAVNNAHDSLTPLGGFTTLLMMELGEVALGGVGSGMYGILIFVIVAVFVAGLMVGRTPEYLGKKIEPFEMKMAALLIIIMPLMVLGLTAVAVSTDAGGSAVSNPGPHGFSQILYAFTSQGNNNGSAFAGLAVNTPFYNSLGALAMLISRFWLAVPTLALAGSLVTKRQIAAGAGTLSTTSLLFIVWLLAIILIVGALNFVPALALGPLVEHLLMIGA
jgi:K+-transporting ATPase ATPase A chain